MENPKKETQYFVAPPSGEDPEILPRGEIRSRLRQGKLRQSQFIWDPRDQTWKQAREFPDLSHPPTTDPQPPATPSPSSTQESQAKDSLPKVEKDPAPTSPIADPKQEKSPPIPNTIDQVYRRHRLAQRLYGGLLILILALIPMGNYLLAHRTVKATLAQSRFKDSVTLSAHFSWYVQPQNLVIEISDLPLGMSGVNFIELLTLTATAIPETPLIGTPFHAVRLNRGRTTQFALTGEVWKRLALEAQEAPEKRAALLATCLYYPNGKQVLSHLSDDLSELQHQKIQVFLELYKAFVEPLESETLRE